MSNEHTKPKWNERISHIYRFHRNFDIHLNGSDEIDFLAAGLTVCK